MPLTLQIHVVVLKVVVASILLSTLRLFHLLCYPKLLVLNIRPAQPMRVQETHIGSPGICYLIKLLEFTNRTQRDSFDHALQTHVVVLQLVVASVQLSTLCFVHLLGHHASQLLVHSVTDLTCRLGEEEYW